ncbi:unnamed protein product, partial [Pylaiella littoralis]
ALVLVLGSSVLLPLPAAVSAKERGGRKVKIATACVRECVCCRPIYPARQSTLFGTCGASAGDTQEREQPKRFFVLSLPFQVLAYIFTARRVLPSVSLVDILVEFCVLPT